MKFEEFQLERNQSTWENKVDYNLTESGVHPGTIKSLFDSDFIQKIENTVSVIVERYARFLSCRNDFQYNNNYKVQSVHSENLIQFFQI